MNEAQQARAILDALKQSQQNVANAFWWWMVPGGVVWWLFGWPWAIPFGLLSVACAIQSIRTGVLVNQMEPDVIALEQRQALIDQLNRVEHKQP